MAGNFTRETRTGLGTQHEARRNRGGISRDGRRRGGVSRGDCMAGTYTDVVILLRSVADGGLWDDI